MENIAILNVTCGNVIIQLYPEISPNGEMVLFQRNFKDIMTDKNLSNIWIVNFDGSDMRPITTGNHN